jgi:hypothetical protein
MAEEGPRPSRSRSPILLLLAVGLALAVAWLLAERNARQWWLVPEEGRVVVKRGVFFPAGKVTFKSDDPEMSRTYAPLAPPPGSAVPQESAFDDRAALDQALFDWLARWAREDIQSEQMARMERARGYLQRSARLAGLSPAQRDQLRTLQAETAFQEAVEHLKQGAEALRRALEGLRLAAEARGPVAAEAAALGKALDPVAASTGQLMLEASRFAAERYRASPAPAGAAAEPPAVAKPPAAAEGPAAGAPPLAPPR